MRFTRRIEKELLFDALLFLGGIISISLFFRNNVVLTGLLILAWILGLKFWHKREDIFFFLSGSIVGPVGEIVCIKFGVWSYSNPSFFGIPMWLPFAWGLATVLIKRFAETFYKMFR